jgi:DNA-binding transcriptional LysR family regulator
MPSGQRIAAAMEIYVRVAELRSFHRAAAALGLTPSAVSKATRRLEDRLGIMLLDRTTRRVQLTREGALLLEHGRRALREIEDAAARLSQSREQVDGIVNVEAWPPFVGQTIVAPTLPELLRRNPGLIVQLSLRDPPRDPRSLGFDLAVCHERPDVEGLVVRAATLVGRIVLCASPAYLDAAGRPRTIEDLKSHACLGLVERGRVAPWPLSTDGGTETIEPHGPFASTSKDVLVDASVRGVGIVRVADFMVARHLEMGVLETVLDAFATSASVPIFLVRPAGRWVPRRTRAVAQYLADAITCTPV